jgi:hypothetical protein
MSSTTALTPQVPPRWRLATLGTAALLVLAALLLLTVLRSFGSVEAPTGPGWSAVPSLAAVDTGDALARRLGWLTHATWTFTGIALLLALAQRSLHDLALAGAGALWGLLFEQRVRAMHPPDFTPTALTVGLQVVFIGALGVSLWYGLRLLRRSGLRPHPLSLTRLLTLSGLAALVLGLNGTLKQPVYWVLPIASVLACGGALVRMVDMARRPGSLLRPSLAAWLLALAVACLVAAGCRELWLQAGEPPASEQLRDAWLTTRSAIVLVLVCALGLRLDQLARMLRQLGGSHSHWRRRLREVQRHLAQARERLALTDRTATQQAQRDHLLRELHDDLGHRLLDASQWLDDTAAARPAQALIDSSLHELQLAYDALGTVPRPLAEALQRLHLQLAAPLEEAGVALQWTIDGPATTLVLNQVETLQLLRMVRGAFSTTLDRHARQPGEPMPGTCLLRLDVADGETGRHLRLQLKDEPAAAPAARLGAEWTRLQRQATSLGAQLALDAQAGPGRQGWSVELVMPLAGR